MLAFTVLFCFVIINYELILAQYFVSTKLKPDDVEVFCLKQCGSTFGSIHNEQQLQSVQSLSNFYIDNGIWIGLKAIDNIGNYEWIDSTPFDFAKWASNEPSGNILNKECVAMTSIDFEWTTNECMTARKSVCNHCNGKLNKYILLYLDVMDSGYSYSSAQSACSSYSTHSKLASLHSNRDLSEARNLCALLGADCLIGLNDIDSEGLYIYDDGTPFDFMSNSMTIHHADKDCVHLSASNDYSFMDTFCDGTLSINYALCQMPSQLCDDSAWTKMNGNWDILDDCTSILSENSDFVLADKLWYNGPDVLVIDYTFSFVISSNSGYSGLTIYSSLQATTCAYYYIFLQKLSTNLFYLGLLYHHGSTTTLLEFVAVVANVVDTNLLSIHITPHTNIFNLYLNDRHIVSHTDDKHLAHIKHDGYSGYIGLKSSLSATTTAKSLYVSGTGYNVIDINAQPITVISQSNCPTSSPSTSPTTAVPTHSPTMHPSTSNPTLPPSFLPTTSPSKQPTIPPTFAPSLFPTNNPSFAPTVLPTMTPTFGPSFMPSIAPTFGPSYTPTKFPTLSPSYMPTVMPTYHPLSPSYAPTVVPSKKPTSNPTDFPTVNPSYFPTVNPSYFPTNNPLSTLSPTANPTHNPSMYPTVAVVRVFGEMGVTVDQDSGLINFVLRLEHIFILIEDIDAIIDVMELISMNSIIVDCGYGFSAGFESGYALERAKQGITIINASIVSCNTSAHSKFIWCINSSYFEQQLITNIKQEISVEIVFNQHAVVKYKQLQLFSTTTTTTTTATTTNVIDMGVGDEEGLISWMLKFVLLQLGICCLLIVLYFALKIRTKKLKVNKLAVQQKITLEKINKQIHIKSPKIEGLILDDDDIITSQYESNGVANLKKMNRPPRMNKHNTNSSTMPLSDMSDHSDGSDMDGDEKETKYTNYYVKQLMNRMIANKNSNISHRKSKVDTVSFNSTYPMNRIDTDTTFPPIPISTENNHTNSDVTGNNSAPIPDSLGSESNSHILDIAPINTKKNTTSSEIFYINNINNINNRHQTAATPSSSLTIPGQYRKSSYITICEKCGTSHPINYDDANQETNCTVISKFNKNQY